MHGLLIRKGPLEKILSGKKTWEMRSTASTRRETIALIESRSGTIVGTATMTGCIGPLSKTELMQNANLHQGSDEAVEQLFNYKRPHAWVLSDVHRFQTPIPYDHPSGAVIWVNLAQYDAKIRTAK